MNRIYVDFNSPYGNEKVPLKKDDVKHLKIGSRLCLYCEDMEVEANLVYEDETSQWFGIPDWRTQ
jgi:hypothetical protein